MMLTFKLHRAGLLAGCALIALGACAPRDTRLPERVAEPGDAQPVDVTPTATNTSRFAVVSGNDTAGPPNAIPGQCYAQAQQPARFETVSTQVVDRPAAERFTVVPATYRTETLPVVVEEAYSRLEVTPAVYETIMETVIVEPARERTITIPAEYRSVSVDVPVSPSYREWVPSGQIFPTGTSALGGRVIGNRSNASGATETLIEFAAQTRTEQRQELVRAATTQTEFIPAVTREVPRRIVVQPAVTREVVVPAVTQNVTREVVAVAERVDRIEVPATFRTVDEPTQVLPAQTVWAAVVCDTSYNPTLITSVQRGLKDQGYYTGAVDGIWGAGTSRALRSYQRDGGIDTSALTLDTLGRLGLSG